MGVPQSHVTLPTPIPREDKSFHMDAAVISTGSLLRKQINYSHWNIMVYNIVLELKITHKMSTNIYTYPS